MSSTALTETRLAEAVAALAEQDARLRNVLQRHGTPSLRAGAAGLPGLLQIMTEQFLSLAAARAIWLRLDQQLAPWTAERVLAAEQPALVGLGLSRAKAKHFHGVAASVQAGTFSFAGLDQLSDAAAHKALLALPGVGPWTADIYLLSALLRADAFPAGDLALQVAAQDLFMLPERPSARQLVQAAEPFRPHRAVLARLLWSHYRHLKGLAQA